MAKEKGRIDSKELLVIKKVDPERMEKYVKNGYKLRVVQWLFEGKGKDEGTIKSSVSVEKRETYLDDDDVTRIGKAKGFALEDMALLQQNWADVVKAMKNPPAPAWPEGSRASQPKAQPTESVPTETIEDVPF